MHRVVGREEKRSQEGGKEGAFVGRQTVAAADPKIAMLRGTAAIYPYRIFTVIIQAAALAAAVLAAAAALRLAPVEGACAEARPLRVCSELLA